MIQDLVVATKQWAHEIIKQHKFHSFKIYIVQKLNEYDPVRTPQFCVSVEHLIATQLTLSDLFQ